MPCVKGLIPINSNWTRRCEFHISRSVVHVSGSALLFPTLAPLFENSSCFVVKSCQRKSDIGTVKHVYVIFVKLLVLMFLVVHLSFIIFNARTRPCIMNSKCPYRAGYHKWRKYALVENENSMELGKWLAKNTSNAQSRVKISPLQRLKLGTGVC
jgi:hypothetical protein